MSWKQLKIKCNTSNEYISAPVSEFHILMVESLTEVIIKLSFKLQATMFTTSGFLGSISTSSEVLKQKDNIFSNINCI